MGHLTRAEQQQPLRVRAEAEPSGKRRSGIPGLLAPMEANAKERP